MRSENNIEELLAEAGIEFTIVDRCPDPGCVVCSRGELPKAA